MQVKKIKSIFEFYIKQKIEFRFVLFSIGQTLDIIATLLQYQSNTVF